MFEDFFVRAVAAGLGVALIAGPLGCFIVWRHMAYFGDTISHSGLLGVALGLMIGINVVFGVFCAALIVAFFLLLLERKGTIPVDALLGILSHSMLAIGLVMIATMTDVAVDLESFLLGDILAVSAQDLWIIYGGGTFVAVLLFLNWRALLAASVAHDLAHVEGLNPFRARLIFILLIAIVVAAAMKIIGILLITALLVIPPAAARPFSKSPEQMALFASLIGGICVVLGLLASLYWDTPSGPSITVAAFLIFLLSLAPSRGMMR